jgi:hypothetical protein
MRVLFESEYDDRNKNGLLRLKVDAIRVLEISLSNMSFSDFHSLNNFIRGYGNFCKKQESELLIKELEHIIYRLKED